MSKSLPSFTKTLKAHGVGVVREKTIDTLQVNIGKRCNQACHHCHVESGPNRTENMVKATVDRLLALLAESKTIHTVDITGGAPELNPHFKYFVSEIRKLGINVIDRCNLTVLFEPGQADTAQFLKDHQVQIVSSLPCYTLDNVEKQRGKGVFDKSIRALQLLNELGYGHEGSDLILNLVYNPVGAFLPPSQTTLEQDYKKILKQEFNIVFNQLLTITNMPIKRFEHFLKLNKQFDKYMDLLFTNFNIKTTDGLMCRNLISIGYNGEVYDCDFNQMLELPVGNQRRTIWDISSLNDLAGDIAFGLHCYGCTAGTGSSCGGTIA